MHEEMLGEWLQLARKSKHGWAEHTEKEFGMLSHEGLFLYQEFAII